MEREREGEKYQCVVASCVYPTGDLALNPGMCPDLKSNQWPFRSQASTQSTEPHQPGQINYFLKNSAFWHLRIDKFLRKEVCIYNHNI